MNERKNELQYMVFNDLQRYSSSACNGSRLGSSCLILPKTRNYRQSADVERHFIISIPLVYMYNYIDVAERTTVDVKSYLRDAL